MIAADGLAPQARAAVSSASAPSTDAPSPSISQRLARTLALLVALALGVASSVIYCATAMRLQSMQQDTLSDKSRVLGDFIAVASRHGEGELLRKLSLFEPVRSGTVLTLTRGDGTLLFHDAVDTPLAEPIAREFAVETPLITGGRVQGRVEIDAARDRHMLHGLAVTLALVTLLCGGLTGLGIRWLVRRDLRPLASLAAQTRAISARRLDQRLRLDRPAEELQPWIGQFNALMDRLEQAYAQLEGFNADVAHELRTPLATLIGETEVALSRERSAESLRETLWSNLEEMQRMSALVNDMLFLSHADRGAVARRGPPVSLAALARQVADYHDAVCDEAGLRIEVDGDAEAAVDEPLLKRAVSNLVSNATRYARPGSTVHVRIAPTEPRQVQVLVDNEGPAIAPQHLPRLFDRFFRADAARPEGQQHHGLGLAIVAAIARMHGGHPLAACDGGVTRVGFTLARG